MKLAFPAGSTAYTDATGASYTADASGMLDIGSADPGPFEAAGFVPLPDVSGGTSARPTTGLAAGLMYFDTTLNKPVWRNATNTGWVDATGTSA